MPMRNRDASGTKCTNDGQYMLCSTGNTLTRKATDTAVIVPVAINPESAHDFKFLKRAKGPPDTARIS